MRLKFLKEQTDWVDDWTKNLISDITEEECQVVDSLNSSINWVYGHIVISKYFHALQSVLEEDHKLLIEINQKLPIQDLFKYYFAGSNPDQIWGDRPSLNQLIAFGNEIDHTVNQVLDDFAESNLNDETTIGNPIAKIKYDALTFSFKHQMWHGGQIAMMKRIMRG